MRRTNSDVPKHILAATAAMLDETDSANIRVSAIAERANVGVPSIYYYFTSLPQLISLAQGLRHNELWAPLDDILVAMTSAVDNEDEAAYWAAWDQVFVVGWDPERRERMRHIAELLIDVRRDAAQSKAMREKQELQLKQRIEVIDKAKGFGWIDPDVDARSLSLIFWGSFIGQHLNFGSDLHVLEPEMMQKIFTKILRGRRAPTDDSVN